LDITSHECGTAPVRIITHVPDDTRLVAAARYRDGLRMRVNAVLDELGNRLQGVALRERDDAYGVPVIPDLELAVTG
jgi:hypothetical protein